MKRKLLNRSLAAGMGCLTLCVVGVTDGTAQPVPGGTLDPLTIPKYVTPLVIPPVMTLTGSAALVLLIPRRIRQPALTSKQAPLVVM